MEVGGERGGTELCFLVAQEIGAVAVEAGVRGGGCCGEVYSSDLSLLKYHRSDGEGLEHVALPLV